MKFFNALLKACIFIFLLSFLVYLARPSPKFPKPPIDSVQSLEEADLETPLRRSYFTDFSRQQILDYYQREFGASIPIPVPSYMVYYPPEDAQTLIRDQTRSVYLPEIIHPFRESLYVNIFEARSPKDAISYRGIDYDRKITVRYVPSSPWVRIPVIFSSLILLLFLLKQLVKSIVDIIKI